MSEKLVTVKTEKFEATLPWLYAISPLRLLDIATTVNGAEQFSKTLESMKELIAPDKLPKLETLNLLELGDVINAWLAETEKLKGSKS